MSFRKYLSQTYEIGYHSVASMYVEKEIEYGGSEDIAREFRKYIDEYISGGISNYEYRHLMFIATFMKEGHFEVYNNDIGDVLEDLVEIGLKSDNHNIQEMAIMVCENFTENDYLLKLLESTICDCEWIDSYRLQVIEDIKEFK